jgi:hypothetical protein
MSSTKERVAFPGILRGEGHEASCTVWATKVTQQGTGNSAYARYSIENVSRVLPEGNYQVSANGQSFAVRFANGNWLASF